MSTHPVTQASPRLLTPKDAYVMDYQTAVDYAEAQMEIYWLPTEIKVEKDVQDLRVEMNDAERHGVITTLKLFTLYELRIGSDYWLGRVAREFQRPDIEFMATTFGFVEIGIHARFYNQINEAMMLDTEEFYNSYLDDPILKSRMEFIEAAADSPDLLLSLGSFSMIEGAILYSSFAFLKHFQSNGKNRLLNVTRGINFSVRDENLHSEAGAWLFRTLLAETELDDLEAAKLQESLEDVAWKIYEHECRIIDMTFEHGDMEGIDADEMKEFVRSRLNLCLENLGYGPIFVVEDNPVASWFYDGINGYQMHDFFTGQGSEYHRSWDQTRFVW